MRILSLLAIVLVCVGCSASQPTEPPTPIPTTDFFQLVFPTVLPTAATPDLPTLWLALEMRTPVPYTTPLPPAATSQLDGAWVKFDPSIAPRIQCRRCPDWKPEGGVWKVSMAQGVFRIVHASTGWKSISSFTVDQDKLYLFNDPYCTDDVGIYAWAIKNRTLNLSVVQDDCSMKLRGINLGEYPWVSCLPPNREAAVSGHWPVPMGCE